LESRLTSERVRTAPPGVRRWIESQVATSLGLQAQISERARIEHLAICSLEELGYMLTLIRDTFPAVNVLFELGRPGASFAPGRVEAYRLSDILHHTRLQNVDQVVTCLELINEAYVVFVERQMPLSIVSIATVIASSQRKPSRTLAPMEEHNRRARRRWSDRHGRLSSTSISSRSQSAAGELDVRNPTRLRPF